MTYQIKRLIRKVLRIILALLSCFIITTVSITSIHAETRSDLQRVGYFNGKEYPIIEVNPNISPLYAVNGYAVTSQVYINGSYVSFNQAYQLPNTNARDFRIVVTFPETIEKNQNVDFTLRTTFVGEISSATIFFSDGDGEGTTSTESLSVRKTAKDNFSLIIKDVVPNDASRHCYITFNGKPSSTDFAMVTTFVEITGISTDGLLASIGHAISGILTALANLPSNIANAFQSLFSMITDAISGLGSLIVGAIDNMIQALSSILNAIRTAITTMMNTLFNAITTLMNTLVDALVTLGNFLIDGLKMLFIPKDDYFTNYFNELYKFFSDKLGILLYPFTLILTIINLFLGITAGTGVIHIPDIIINDWHIIYAQDYAFKNTIVTALGSQNYQLYLAFVDVIIIVMLVNYARKMFDEVVGGHNDS